MTPNEILSQRKQKAAILASHYTTTKRSFEIFFVVLWAIFLSLTLVNLWTNLSFDNIWTALSGCILSMILADLFSGLVHWGADTWGTLDSRFVGGSFIRSFREHHVDPFRITHHDFVEANGDNCMLTFGLFGFLSFYPINKENSFELFLFCFLSGLCLWLSVTNQIHKWAHTPKPPKMVTLLQEFGIFLSRKNHQIHHHNPFDRYYCITNGWLNPLLGSIAFWKRMEITIEWATGAKPRFDDALWTLQTDSTSVQ